MSTGVTQPWQEIRMESAESGLGFKLKGWGTSFLRDRIIV